MIVSELERLGRGLEALRVRVEALERRLVPVVEVSEEEAGELERLRGEAENRDYVSLDEVVARHNRG